MSAFDTMPLSRLSIPTMTLNALNEGGYFTIGEVVGEPDSVLMRLPNLGRVGIKALRAAIEHVKASGDVLKTDAVTVSLSAEQRVRLDAASTIGPYRIAVPDIIARGIDLAISELENRWGDDEGSAAA